MEKQEMKMGNQERSRKKTLIVCITTIAVVTIVLVCVLIINSSKTDTEDMDAVLMNSDMTFEEFCDGMKEDLSDEVMAEVEQLYEEAKQALEAEDNDALNEVYEKLAKLDVYEAGTVNDFDSHVIIDDENSGEPVTIGDSVEP